MTGTRGPDTGVTSRHGGILSVSRCLQAIAAVLLFLIVGVTVHQLMTLRAAVVADTERQMSRLDMVFAEQTGRAVETVDLMLRNAIETSQIQRAAPVRRRGCLAAPADRGCAAGARPGHRDAAATC